MLVGFLCDIGISWFDVDVLVFDLDVVGWVMWFDWVVVLKVVYEVVVYDCWFWE